MRRAGGGFGGRLTHPVGPACAAAVAARHLKLPVRLALNRESDLRICGGREETVADYEAQHNDEGKIEALKMIGHCNSGVTPDLSWFGNMSFVGALSQVYYIPNLTSKSSLVKTNLPTRTALRAPGEPQAAYVMETIIEQIAHKLKVPPHVIRERNFFPTNLPADKMVAPSESLCWK
jgi:xanthine dehydrogenase molybdopterin-binding subunit B